MTLNEELKKTYMLNPKFRLLNKCGLGWLVSSLVLNPIVKVAGRKKRNLEYSLWITHLSGAHNDYQEAENNSVPIKTIIREYFPFLTKDKCPEFTEFIDEMVGYKR